MAETNLTSSATNSDGNASSPSVPGSAGGISRRTVMNMMSAVAAVPAVALVPTKAASTQTADRSEWDAAFARYELGEAAYERASVKYDAEVARAEREGRTDRNAEFAEYGLEHDRGRSREQLIRDTEMRVTMRDFAGREQLSADDFAAIARKATELVDDFIAYSARNHRIWDAIIDPAEREHDKAVEARHETRQALLETPAPDALAVLTKLGLLLKIIDGDWGADDLARIHDDARRLFSA